MAIRERFNSMNKNKILIAIIAIIVISIGFKVLNPSSNSKELEGWTLVIKDGERQRTEISGYPSGRECVEKALSLIKEGDYFNCGHDCVYSSKTSDGIRCQEYCGRGGCASVK